MCVESAEGTSGSSGRSGGGSVGGAAGASRCAGQAEDALEHPQQAGINFHSVRGGALAVAANDASLARREIAASRRAVAGGRFHRSTAANTAEQLREVTALAKQIHLKREKDLLTPLRRQVRDGLFQPIEKLGVRIVFFDEPADQFGGIKPQVDPRRLRRSSRWPSRNPHSVSGGNSFARSCEKTASPTSRRSIPHRICSPRPWFGDEPLLRSRA